MGGQCCCARAVLPASQPLGVACTTAIVETGVGVGGCGDARTSEVGISQNYITALAHAVLVIHRRKRSLARAQIRND